MAANRERLQKSRHNLFQVEHDPLLFLQRVLRVRPDEVKLLLWVTLIQLVMRTSSILVNNFAQTAFLKRFGVQHLPTIFLIEAVLTFFFSLIVGLLMDRHRTLRVFTWLLLFFALAAGIIRGLLPLQIILIYPILYILKSQAEEILPILYWDILNDLFTTQQSKRLYTLIIAGGVLGNTLGNLMTGTVARWVGVNNLLFIFVGGMILAAFLNELTEKVAGAPIETRVDRRRGKRQGNFTENLQEFVAFSRRSPLLRYMILLIAIPNIVLPILMYQFNVVVDSTFATEKATLQFFGIFRGLSNAVMFGILLFSGRLVTSWGVATTLLLHPINYLVAFLGLLFRFDFVTAVYARFSTETLKTTLNNPARAILYYFFPTEMRGLIRVFLRGTVVRASDFLGSGFLLLVKGLVAPNLLSVIAAPLVLAWVFTSIRIRKTYSSMLVQTLMEKHIDWDRLEEADFRVWVNDKRTIQKLQQGLRDERPELAVACGEILAKVSPPGWAGWIVGAIPGRPVQSQKILLDLLRPEDARETVEGLLHLTHNAPADMLVPLLYTLSRLDPKASLSIMEEFKDHPDWSVRLEALAGLYLSNDPQARRLFRARVAELLRRNEEGVAMAVQVLEKTGDPSFAGVLLRSARGKDTDLKARALSGLGKMKFKTALEMASTAIHESHSQIRKSALEVMTAFGEETPLEQWIELLGEQDAKVREQASIMIRQRGREAIQPLLPQLASPSKTMRNEVLSILEYLGAPPVELSQFMTRELEKAYHNLAIVGALKRSEKGRAVSLLKEHLTEKNTEILEIVLRVLGIVEFGDRMKVILKAVQSGERRDMDNAIEVLETSLHSNIRKILIPLVEERPLEEKLKVAQKRLGTSLLLEEPVEAIFSGLLEDSDPVTQALVIHSLGEGGGSKASDILVSRYLESENQTVAEAARWFALRTRPEFPTEGFPVKDPNLVEKVQWLREIPLFSNLRVHELAAIALITVAKRYLKHEAVVHEEEPGDGLYIVMEGDLHAIEGARSRREMIREHLQKGDFFGEIALIDGRPGSETVRANSDTLLLVIKSEDFARIIQDDPAISLNICKIFCRRIRGLQRRLPGVSQGTEEEV